MSEELCRACSTYSAMPDGSFCEACQHAIDMRDPQMNRFRFQSDKDYIERDAK